MFDPESTDPFRLTESYFRTEPFVDNRTIVYEGRGRESGLSCYWFVHTLSSIFTAITSADLRIAHFQEYAHSNREHTYDVYENQKAQLPMCYTLTAIRR